MEGSGGVVREKGESPRVGDGGFNGHDRRRRRCPVVLTGRPVVRKCSGGPGLSEERILSAETDRPSMVRCRTSNGRTNLIAGIKEGKNIVSCDVIFCARRTGILAV